MIRCLSGSTWCGAFIPTLALLFPVGAGLEAWREGADTGVVSAELGAGRGGAWIEIGVGVT